MQRRLDGKPQAPRSFKAVTLTKQVRRCTTEELQVLANRIGGELSHRSEAATLTKQVKRCTTEELQSLANSIGVELSYRFKKSIETLQEDGVVWEMTR